LRKLEALERALGGNAKIVIPSGSELVNVIGEMAGVLPLVDGARERRAGNQHRGAAELERAAQQDVKPRVARDGNGVPPPEDARG
jgi:hypothetical protein